MTIAFNDAYTQYTGTGAKTFFEFGFPILDGSAVYVTIDGLPVVFIMQETGVVLDPAPALNAVIEIYRWTNVDQLADFTAFESFDAEKTEDAVDKLIMLKQEGWFRGVMNLFADPKLDMVILVNDKGEDAKILIWNEHTDGPVINDAGVFAGEVTQQMPCPGAVVAKPDHFAFFQYGLAGRTQVLTTTLYPAETLDAMEIGISLVSGRMDPIPIEEYEFTLVALNGNITPILLTAPTQDEEYEFTLVALNGSITQILLTAPTEEEEYEFTLVALDGNVESKLVEAELPDEAMDIGISLISGSMTPV
jgi:hypothetical protein